MLPLLMIGSEALRDAGIETGRPHLDFDFIATPEAASAYIKWQLRDGAYPDAKVRYSEDAKCLYLFRGMGMPIIEFELAWPGSTALELLNMVSENKSKLTFGAHPEYVGGLKIYAASPKLVYALKMSHRFKKNSAHFKKTRDDILMLRRLGHGKLPKGLSDWYKARVKETYSYKHPKLQGVKKVDFFKDDGIQYVYDHDAIHQVVKHLPAPAYSYFQPEGEEIGTSKEEFFKQTRLVQLLAVLEESYVLSLERAIIPYNLWDDEAACRKAFETALEKVCTSITSGWFRTFAWENYDTVRGMYDIEYVKRFKSQADAGFVAPYT